MNIRTLITVLNVSTILLCGLIWLGAVVFLRVKKYKSFVYLLFFTIFYFYIVAVLFYTIFKFQSLFLLNWLSPNRLMLKAHTVAQGINLVPLVALRLADVKTSLLNILLFVPFGFGLPFITKLQMRKVVITGALFSITIELLQLLTGVLAHESFRTADINDVIFNTTGAAIGYLLFILFIRIYRNRSRNWKIVKHPILRYIAERPQRDVPLSGKSKKILIAALVVTIAAVATSYAIYPKGDNQGSAIPQGGNLCGNTDGTGQIISKGYSVITIKRYDGVVQTISLTAETDIRNSTGTISESGLKIGDHVTLVVHDHKTASIVLVCKE
jgi:glycopeptide antibiotics resistance protein